MAAFGDAPLRWRTRGDPVEYDGAWEWRAAAARGRIPTHASRTTNAADSIRGNGVKLPVDRVDDAVLRALGGDKLRPAAVTAIIDGVLAGFSPAALGQERDCHRTLVTDLEKEIVNLTRPSRRRAPSSRSWLSCRPASDGGRISRTGAGCSRGMCRMVVRCCEKY
jgi:hypothetical protein